MQASVSLGHAERNASKSGVGNCFGSRAASRSRKLDKGRTFKRTHWYIILIDLHF